MSRRIDLLGISFVSYAAFTMVICFVTAVGLVMLQLVDPELPLAIIAGAAVFTVAFGAVVSAPFAAVGVGLGRRMWWSRGAALALSALVVGSIPVGTALGLFSFVTLIDDSAGAEFARG